MGGSADERAALRPFTVSVVATTSVMWFRRDLRLRDNPALLAAVSDGDVMPLFVLDPRLWRSAGPARKAWLVRSLRALDESLGGALVVRHGDPTHVVPEAAQAAEASAVHVAADFGPYGRERDVRVEKALADAGVPLVRTGSPYAVAPGRLVTGEGGGFRVYSPYNRAWEAHGWRDPAPAPRRATWVAPLPSEGLPD